MARMDEASQLRTATEKGIEQGREEGRQAMIETAKKMKKAGMDIAMICEFTALSEETVLGL